MEWLIFLPAAILFGVLIVFLFVKGKPFQVLKTILLPAIIIYLCWGTVAVIFSLIDKTFYFEGWLALLSGVVLIEIFFLARKKDDGGHIGYFKP